MRPLTLPLLVACLALVACGGGAKRGAADAAAGVAVDDGGGARRGPGGGLLEPADGGAADAPASPLDAAQADAPYDTTAADATGDDAGAADAVRDAVADDGSVCSSTTCDGLATDYKAALAKAQSCNTLLKGQCAEQRPAALTCSCNVWVNVTTELDALRARYDDAGCSRCVHVPCSILCRKLTAGVCRTRGPVVLPDPILGSPGFCQDQTDPAPL